MESKRKSIYITIFVITTIVASCVAVYFKINGDKRISEIEQASNGNNTQENTQYGSNKTDTESTVVEKTVKEYKFYPELDSAKCINPYENAKYELRISQELVTLTCLVNSDRKSAVLTTDWEYAHNVWGFTPNGGNGAYEQYNADNFSSEIVSVISTGWGQTSDYSTLLFLMKDGSVEYIPVYKAYKTGTFKSFGKISGVTDIAYIGNATATYGEEPIAMKADGTFYRLSELLEKTGNYTF